VKLSTALTTTAIVAVTAFAALPASADQIDRRQYNQSYRIDQGVRSGQLNYREAGRLRHEQDRIREMERFARRDHYVSPWERFRIRMAQNRASRHIYVEKHDYQRRGSWWQRRFWSRYN
jgi:hypothetical protein